MPAGLRAHGEGLKGRFQRSLAAVRVVERNGRDRYGRTLAQIRVGRNEAGAILVREGLAKRWRGGKAA